MRKYEGAGGEGWSVHLHGVSSTVLKAAPLDVEKCSLPRKSAHAASMPPPTKVKVHLPFEDFLELKPPNKIKFP